eukprot:scaffold3052_cov389-Prasinococcus_capsulatus_cf.AAC.20
MVNQTDLCPASKARGSALAERKSKLPPDAKVWPARGAPLGSLASRRCRGLASSARPVAVERAGRRREA